MTNYSCCSNPSKQLKYKLFVLSYTRTLKIPNMYAPTMIILFVYENNFISQPMEGLPASVKLHFVVFRHRKIIKPGNACQCCLFEKVVRDYKFLASLIIFLLKCFLDLTFKWKRSFLLHTP
eukprot:TRINITY_DN286_c0_g1_i1.p2 TRINITY_DN286_c0_g1~~TRINITY_DN286_c0_g1_i1.p2  ORF type:complete len:121 (+),score=10.99 TRINITY_DN286_c0_g1_i1:151-513(+)